MIAAYYNVRGLDSHGVPAPATTAALGLDIFVQAG
jgi:hypothetical protein